MATTSPKSKAAMARTSVGCAVVGRQPHSMSGNNRTDPFAVVKYLEVKRPLHGHLHGPIRMKGGTRESDLALVIANAQSSFIRSVFSADVQESTAIVLCHNSAASPGRRRNND